MPGAPFLAANAPLAKQIRDTAARAASASALSDAGATHWGGVRLTTQIPDDAAVS